MNHRNLFTAPRRVNMSSPPISIIPKTPMLAKYLADYFPLYWERISHIKFHRRQLN